MATRAAVKERRKQVIALVLQGVTIENMAKQLAVTPRTIDFDLAASRKEIGKKLQNIDFWDRLGEYTEAQRQRLAKLWEIITDESSKKRDVLMAVKLLQEEESLKVKRDQMAGILPKEPPLISLNQLNIEGKVYPFIGELVELAEKNAKADKGKDKKVA